MKKKSLKLSLFLFSNSRSRANKTSEMLKDEIQEILQISSWTEKDLFLMNCLYDVRTFIVIYRPITHKQCEPTNSDFFFCLDCVFAQRGF